MTEAKTDREAQLERAIKAVQTVLDLDYVLPKDRAATQARLDGYKAELAEIRAHRNPS